MHTNLDRWERFASSAAGAGLALVAAQRRDAERSVLSVAAAAFLARGLSGYCPFRAAMGNGRLRDDTRRALGGDRGIHIEESITVRAPAGLLYGLWAEPSNLPRLLPYVERVEDLDGCRSHWTVRGPARTTVEWDAEVVNAVPGELIGWRSLPGADVASAGSVRFRPLPDESTEVAVHLQYNPPAGKLGAKIAMLFGSNPASQVREALRQMKQSLEAGEVPTTEGQPAGKRGKLFAAVGGM